MTNFPSDGIFVTVARLSLFFTLLFSYPVLFHPTRGVVNEIILYVYELFKRRGEGLYIQSSDAEEESLLSSSNSMFRRKEREFLYRRDVVKLTLKRTTVKRTTVTKLAIIILY